MAARSLFIRPHTDWFTTMITNRNRKKRLRGVALSLEAGNKAGTEQKTIRHGHASSPHLSWARAEALR
jgi:hypothetical protein